MGGSSSQVTGYKYSASFILFIGNAIEKVLGINFDKRGWQTPLIDENKNALPHGIVDAPFLYGSNEGGVSGGIHARYGTPDQTPVEFYSEYLLENSTPPVAYQYQSYLAFEDFYVGNSSYMKEMLLWPKRTRIRNDGRRQWYEMREDGAVVCEIGATQNGLSQEEYSNRILNLPELENEWFGTSNKDNQFHKIMNGVVPHTGLISGVVHDFLSQYGGIGKQGFVKTTFPDSLLGLNISFTIYADDGLTGFKWEGGEHTIVRSFSAQGYPDCKEIILQCSSSPLHLEFGITDGVNGGSNSNHKCLIFSEIAKFGLGGGYVEGVDINPIHKIREILTDITAMNKPEAEINEANFTKAADRIFNEGLGISWAIQEKSCIEALNELCYHIEAGIRINRQTGLYEMILFRDDWFADAEIHTLAENKIKSIELEVQNGYEVVNQLNVNFYDRENIKNSSFSVAENASIRNLNGKVNAETVDFPYFMNQRNAEIVAKWKLKQFTSAGWKGSFTTSEKQARKWNRYDIVKINWSRKGIGNLPVRILSLKFGGHTSSTVTIEFEEVVSALGNLSTSIVIDESIDNTVQPPKQCNAKVFELPYFEAVQANGERETNAELTENPEAGFVCAIAEKPQNNSLNAALHVNDGSGFEKSATINYCETVYLNNSINKISSSFVVKNAGNLASVRIGSQIFINDEIMVYQSFDVQTKILTVKRGALDTVPQNHDADSILYFADDFVAIDQTLYVSSEQVEAKVLTTTPSGILSINDAETHIVDFNSRAIRPYPPANVKINGEYWPNEIRDDLIITWVDRNRLQQTGGEILSWFAGGITTEYSVEYVVELYDGFGVLVLSTNVGAANTATVDYSAVTTQKCRVKLYSIRAGYKSIQAFEHELILGFLPPYNLQGAWSNTTQSVDLTWEFDE